jgi:hypothetical protein
MCHRGPFGNAAGHIALCTLRWVALCTLQPSTAPSPRAAGGTRGAPLARMADGVFISVTVVFFAAAIAYAAACERL